MENTDLGAILKMLERIRKGDTEEVCCKKMFNMYRLLPLINASGSMTALSQELIDLVEHQGGDCCFKVDQSIFKINQYFGQADIMMDERDEESCKKLPRFVESDLFVIILPNDGSGVNTIGDAMSKLVELELPQKTWKRNKDGRLVRLKSDDLDKMVDEEKSGGDEDEMVDEDEKSEGGGAEDDEKKKTTWCATFLATVLALSTIMVASKAVLWVLGTAGFTYEQLVSVLEMLFSTSETAADLATSGCGTTRGSMVRGVLNWGSRGIVPSCSDMHALIQAQTVRLLLTVTTGAGFMYKGWWWYLEKSEKICKFAEQKPYVAR